MARTNVATRTQPVTHESGPANRISPLFELRRSVLTCLLFENTFYEAGSDIADRIAELCTKVEPAQIADIAIEARQKMHLRHVPLFLVTQLSKRDKVGPLVADTLPLVIQRADELTEFVSIYWKYGARDGKTGKHPLSAGIKRGLAKAFTRFNAYSLGKYNGGDTAVRLHDVMFLVHPTPDTTGSKDAEILAPIDDPKRGYKRGGTLRHRDGQGAVWQKLAGKTLESPDTWEVIVSRDGSTKETWERIVDMWIVEE